MFLGKESIGDVSNTNQIVTSNANTAIKYHPHAKFTAKCEQKCEECDYKTADTSYMYKHKRRKHSDIKHKCTECDYYNTFPNRVTTHYKQVHLGFPKVKLKFCRKDTCKDVGTDNCTESKHFLFRCTQCEFSTTRGDHLKTHIQRMHEGKVEMVQCGQCDFSTNLRSSLKTHLSRKHIEELMQNKCTDVKQCTFESCSFKTLFTSTLRTHVEFKHEGIVQFRCEFMNCTYATNSRRYLKEHIMRHSSKQVFKCHKCDKSFTKLHQRDRHNKFKHERHIVLKCEYLNCSYETQDKQNLEVHIKSEMTEAMGNSKEINHTKKE